MTVSAVVFDMDGLLLDTEQLYFAAYRDSRTDLGLPPDDALFNSLIGTNNQLGQERLAAGLKNLIDLATFEAHWDDQCAARLAKGIPVKPHVPQVLETLKSKRIPFAIATSTRTPRAWKHLADAGIDHHFDLIIGGEQVARSKPAPDIYLAACTALGKPPEQCAAFEDSENGTRAAHAAGMTTVQVPDLVQPSLEFRKLGHHVAPDLWVGLKMVGLAPAQDCA